MRRSRRSSRVNLGPMLCLPHEKSPKNKSNINNKLCEELIAYFPLILHGPHRKRSVRNLFYCCLCVRCRGNVFTDPLPSNEWKDTFTDTQTDRGDLGSTPLTLDQVP
jgi:hypothetical protein